MDLFRYGHDAWGREVINGLSWDLLGLAVGLGFAVIAVHWVWRAVARTGRKGGH